MYNMNKIVWMSHPRNCIMHIVLIITTIAIFRSRYGIAKKRKREWHSLVLFMKVLYNHATVVIAHLIEHHRFS